ncbi:hypothetical protein JJD41_15235 [Oxynema sp. CENA135]|uniref:hypothetical protein n=1 Tax=Oxynema sp. CENA135 TaxID=984206 RepID=UPI001A528B2C|nr:hypothetical protein [Oxynema sp. CENA135]MBK4731205.1 hypothetical protein [Oxynema sp. CENA135]
MFFFRLDRPSFLEFGKEEIGESHVGSHGFKIESSFVEFSREIGTRIGRSWGDRPRAKGQGGKGVDRPPLPAIPRAISAPTVAKKDATILF